MSIYPGTYAGGAGRSFPLREDYEEPPPSDGSHEGDISLAEDLFRAALWEQKDNDPDSLGVIAESGDGIAGPSPEELLGLRLRSENWPHLDSEGLSRWFEWELAALQARLDPDIGLGELRSLVSANLALFNDEEEDLQG